MNTYDCIIVGAGISGLSTAYELHRRGASVLVVEARDQAGGSIRSEQTADGFVIENGPNTVVSSSPALHQHFADLGIADERIVADRRGARRYILLNGKLELIPTSPPAFFRSNILSTGGKLRMLAEPLIPRTPMSDESVAAFFTRRVGADVARNLIDPFVSGVYAGKPGELSMQSTFPSLWEAEQAYGSIVLGMIMKMATSGKPKQPKGERKRSEMMSFRSGLIAWPQAIVQALGAERVWFHTRAAALQPAESGEGWHLSVVRNQQEESLHAHNIVLAVPADVAARLVSSVDQEATQALQAIPYPPLAVVHLGFRRADVEHPLDGFGMLCPSKEKRRVLGTLWPSSLFPDRTPTDAVLTTSFVGGARSPELAQQDEEDLIEMVIQEQRALVGVRRDPVFARVTRWERAISQYTAGHAERMAALDNLEARSPGLHVIGNYRNGVSVERCWTKGHELGKNMPLSLATASQ